MVDNATPNAFETLRMRGLASTVDIRRAQERVRIRQSMSVGGSPDPAARVVERLLSDPAYRVGEAAAWYFEFATVEEANEVDRSEMSPHDRTVALWHAAQQVAESEMRGSGDAEQQRLRALGVATGRQEPAALRALEDACDSTADLLNNPMTWQPLEGFVRDLADVRLDSRAVTTAAENAVARWICEALFAFVPLGPEMVREAAELVTDTEDVPEEILDIVAEKVLERAADELESAAAEYESRAEPLFDQIAGDASVANALRAAADGLVLAAQPWAALVDAPDGEPATP